ncbi:ABC transporter substrate-binding protein [Piscinibacter sakaiensis]|uniref:heme/hemin ABC transporter substrate-binding protein n=1 Tax=Piscinibacter sakaiensis TaxID=1547922 RepID=UPI0037263FE4
MHGLLNGRAWSGSARRRRILLAALALPAASLRAQPPRQRIVTVGGALTEIVYALGAEAALVGVDTTSLYPAAAQRLPSVGYARALSAEGVLSLAPTLLLHSQEAGPPAVLSQLAAARLPMERLDLDHRIEGLLAAARRVGRLTGHADAGERLATRLEAEVRIAGRDTAADAMIGLAGGRNALGDATGYKPLSPEAAIAAAPEVILCTEQGLQAAGGIDGLLQAPGLAATPAGRARRVVAMDALLLLGFGPRLPQAVATLADRLVGS